MPVQQQQGDGASRPIEARLIFGDGDVIAGTVAAGSDSARPFHGWLELMDALEAIRAGEPGERREEI